MKTSLLHLVLGTVSSRCAKKTVVIDEFNCGCIFYQMNLFVVREGNVIEHTSVSLCAHSQAVFAALLLVSQCSSVQLAIDL